MTQYISKSAVIAEIERRKKTWSHQDQQYVNGGKDVCDYLLGFLDTLEAIEIGVDFGDPKGDIGTKTVFNDSKVLEISRHGNSRIWQNGDLEDFINELSKQFPDVSFAKLSRIAVRTAKWAKPAWSEDDKKHIIDIIDYLDDYYSFAKDEYEDVADGVLNEIRWLQSI